MTSFRLKAFFLCTLIHGPSWDATRGIREQDGWCDHAAFMDRLVEDGLIIVGGLPAQVTVRPISIEGEDAREIRAPLAEDPWAKGNHLTVGSTEPWVLWLDGRAAMKRVQNHGARSFKANAPHA